jgi:integrase
VFRYAIATARAETDPTSALRGALQRHVARSHPALTTRSELGGIMRAIYGYDGWPSLVAALKIQALCFARLGETRAMEWSELDLRNAIWTIPAAGQDSARTSCAVVPSERSKSLRRSRNYLA